jgi:hypothetical protein
MARVSVEVPAELVEPVRETVLLLYQATAESLYAALRSRHAEGGVDEVEGEGGAPSQEDAIEEIHLHRGRVDELDELVGRLSGEARDVEVSGSRDLIHDVLYGALIDAGERLADVSNRAWRGGLPLEDVQQGAEEVLALDRLLRGLDR